MISNNVVKLDKEYNQKDNKMDEESDEDDDENVIVNDADAEAKRIAKLERRLTKEGLVIWK